MVKPSRLKPHAFTIIFSLMLSITLCTPVFSAAESLEELTQQLNELQQKLSAIETKQATSESKASEKQTQYVVKGETPGSIRLPGTETDLTIGGYVKLDAVYSDISVGSGSVTDQALIPVAIPVGDHDYGNDELVLHARQSRVFAKTNTNTDYGKLRTYVEGDFFSTTAGGDQTVSNSYGFRLRHAYGQLGGLLAGQTWSTFMNMAALSETADFGGGAATTFIRQAQLRWTQPFEDWAFNIALENPETTLVSNGPLPDTTPDNDRFPDIITRFDLKSKLGYYSLAGMARQFRIDDGTYKDSQWGGAASFAGRIPTVGKDDIRFILSYGNALGRYMTTGYAGAILNADTGKIETYDQVGAYLSYRHFWLDNLRSTAVYCYGAADNDSQLLPDTTNKNIQSFITNLFWSPTPQTDLAIEYVWGRRELENGDDGELNRVQLSAMFRFF